MGDCIDRQAVLDGIEELKKSPWATDKRGNGFEYLIKEALEVVADLCVKQLPSVTPKQKMGRWIKEKKHHKDDFQEFDYWDARCSECGARKRIGWTNIRHCPMCGAKMAESEDTE